VAGEASPSREGAASRDGAFEPRGFRPPPWLRGPHLQTVAGRLLRPARGVSYERVRVETPDGDFLDLDRLVPARGAGRGRARPTVLLLHGLEGCSESGYVVETARRLAARGVEAVALNFRGRSGVPNRRRRFYHSGDTADLTHVLGILRSGGADSIGIVGFSLGGNVLLKLLGERRDAAGELVDAAVAVSVPYDLAAAARRMESGPGRLYGALFLRSLRASVRRKAALGHDYDLEALEAVRTLREFDDAFTAPVHGFGGAEEYYRRCSASRYLSRVRVPTLLLQARDDPFLPESALPKAAMRANPHLRPVLTERGGHVGFVAAAAGERRFWAEEEAVRWLTGALATETSGETEHSEARRPE